MDKKYKKRLYDIEYRKILKDKNPNYNKDKYNKAKLKDPEYSKKQNEKRYLRNPNAGVDNKNKIELKDPTYFKRSKLKSKFGITMEQYNNMLKNQNECCKICNKHYSEFKIALAVDHCHYSKKIRGLLCRSCNVGLGHFMDDISTLENAINYLKD